MGEGGTQPDRVIIQGSDYDEINLIIKKDGLSPIPGLSAELRQIIEFWGITQQEVIYWGGNLLTPPFDGLIGGTYEIVYYQHGWKKTITEMEDYLEGRNL